MNTQTVKPYYNRAINELGYLIKVGYEPFKIGEHFPGRDGVMYTVIEIATEKQCEDYCKYLDIPFRDGNRGLHYAKVITD